ncbi:hypothetical protein COCNU_06G016520 [Cocos nucifera]|uniref:NBS-LRR resistance protein n=1 Tax=Cocos nucifera TaxID=13894 RepID=A0A8K0ICK2_COCNU|nr:hypothetical protein COCNU_06G016520 [Cocos nucifera]
MAMILDTFVSRFVELLAELASEEVDMLFGVPGEIKKLHNKLRKISKVLADAERRRINDEAIDDWLKELKDFMYDADDILDLCRIEANRCSEGSSSTSLVSFSFPFLSWIRKPPVAYEIGTKIRELNMKLEEISRGRSEFNLELTSPDKRQVTFQISRKTSPVVEIDTVGSRIEEDTQSLVDLLSKDDRRRNILVFAIVGAGGIGKTTLAQRIYNHQRIQDEFSVKKWVCVSQEFDEINLLKDIFGGAKDDLAENQSRSLLEPKVQSNLRGGIPHKMKLKVSASLFNLPLLCWNFQAVTMIISSFGLPHRASKHCLKWEDLTSFDLDFFCEDIEDVPNSVNVSVGPFIYNVQIRVNFVSEQIPPGTPISEEDSNSDRDDWDYWFGSGGDSHAPENKKQPEMDPEKNDTKRQAPRNHSIGSKELNLELEQYPFGFQDPVPAVKGDHSKTQKPDLPNGLLATLQTFLGKPDPWFIPAINLKVKFTSWTATRTYPSQNINILFPTPTDIYCILALDPKIYPNDNSKGQKIQTCKPPYKLIRTTIADPTISVQHVFKRILSALFSSPAQGQRAKNTTQLQQAIEVRDDKEQVTDPPSHKRSARLRTKKIKSLDLVEESLTTKDILFINSLTAAQITDMGKRCGIIIEPNDQSNPIERLNTMEAQRCGRFIKQVSTAVK